MSDNSTRWLPYSVVALVLAAGGCSSTNWFLGGDTPTASEQTSFSNWLSEQPETTASESSTREKPVGTIYKPPSNAAPAPKPTASAKPTASPPTSISNNAEQPVPAAKPSDGKIAANPSVAAEPPSIGSGVLDSTGELAESSETKPRTELAPANIDAVGKDDNVPTATAPQSLNTKPATDESKDPDAVLDANAALEAFIAALKAQSQDQALPESERRRVEQQLRIASLIADDASPHDGSSLSGLDQRQRQAAAAQLDALRLLMTADTRVSGQAWSDATGSLRNATETLVPFCPLELKGIEFCRAVQSFGVVDPFPQRRFRAGQEVLVYVEVENFDNQPTRDGFETELQGSYRIFDTRDSRQADERLLPLDKQTSRNRRRDYFIAYRVFLPRQLAAGEYRLQLTIDDIKGRKSGATSIDFSIAP